MRTASAARLCLWALLALAVTRADAVTCSVSTTATSFGAYNAASALPLDGIGNVSVTCGNLVSILVGYTIALSAGASGSFAARSLASGANHLGYNLFTSLARSQTWGDGTAGSSTLSDGYLLLLLSDTRSYPVYGRIPAGQNVPPGTYADTIVVTINY